MAANQTTAGSARLAYGVGAIAIGVVYQSLSTLLIYYYTDVVGLSGAQAGLVVFVSTLWDGLADPLIAWAASHTRTRYGQYRPWLLLASFPMGVIFLLMFWRPDLPPGQTFAYALATSLVFRSLFQAVYLPYAALIGQISGDAAERARLAGWKGAFLAASQLGASLLALSLVGWLGHGDGRRGFAAMGLVFAPLISLSLFATGLFTRESARADTGQVPDTQAVVQAVRLMLRNRPLLWLLGAVFLFTSAYSVLGGLTIYLFRTRLGDPGAARWALGAMSGASLVGAPVWAWVAVRRGKRFVWQAGAGGAALASLALYFADPGTAMGVTLFFVPIGFCLQTLSLIQFAALADAVDYGQWRSGQRVSAFGFGTLTLVSKTSIAFGGGIAGLVVSLAGLAPHAAASVSMIDQLRVGMLLVPAAGFAASALLMGGYTINSAQHRDIRAVIDPPKEVGQ